MRFWLTLARAPPGVGESIPMALCAWTRHFLVAEIFKSTKRESKALGCFAPSLEFAVITERFHWQKPEQMFLNSDLISSSVSRAIRTLKSSGQLRNRRLPNCHCNCACEASRDDGWRGLRSRRENSRIAAEGQITEGRVLGVGVRGQYAEGCVSASGPAQHAQRCCGDAPGDMSWSAARPPLSKNPKQRSYFSNQMPRTFASKPDYSVKFWKERGLRPAAT